MTIKIFISDFRANIEKAKLSSQRAIKGNFIAYETNKYKSNIEGFNDCLNILNELEKSYIDNKKLHADNLENFYFDLRYQLLDLINKHLNGTTKRLFRPLKRKVWGYYNSVNKCLRLLKRQIKAYGLM